MGWLCPLWYAKRWCKCCGFHILLIFVPSTVCCLLARPKVCCWAPHSASVSTCCPRKCFSTFNNITKRFPVTFNGGGRRGALCGNQQRGNQRIYYAMIHNSHCYFHCKADTALYVHTYLYFNTLSWRAAATASLQLLLCSQPSSQQSTIHCSQIPERSVCAELVMAMPKLRR